MSFMLYFIFLFIIVIHIYCSAKDESSVLKVPLQ